jgi:YgiT-type zinc finger domain-containing protein
VSEHYVTKACWWGNQLVAIIHEVPAGVCEQCGERYYKAKVLKRIEAMLAERERFRSLSVPAADFAMAEAA